MKVNLIKMLFNANAVQNAQLVPAPMAEGKFNLLVDINQGTWQTVSVESRRGGVRDFSSVEAALNILKSIGLREVLVKLI